VGRIVTATGDPVSPEQWTLIEAAKAGDDTAFRLLIDPFRRELHVHCYRMLGSLHEAEDLVQESLLRAWRRLDSFAGDASFRAWLYKVATNACLNELRRRPRRLPPPSHGPPTDPADEHMPYAAEISHLEPYPDILLDEIGGGDPQARLIARETIELAFLTAIELLTPKQRAVLILREVVGWTAAEVAALLDTSVASVTSALQRARATIASAQAAAAGARTAHEQDASLLRRYMRAWEEADMEALAALLKDDAVLTMPPAPSWYRGAESITGFFSSFVFADPTRRIRLLATRANRQPAFAAYLWDPESERYVSYGIMVLRLEETQVAEITGFGDPDLFRFFDLPESLPGPWS
jgi:RNA polymerase sigma-70 factor, ECF subfamily